MKLIDKDKVVAEIEKRKSELQSRIVELGTFESNTLGLFQDVDLYDDILSFLSTLKTKEVDLNRESAWKPADGDELPEIDREVIVLLSNNKACFAHRPQEYWDGKNIATGEITRYYPKRYDKGNWNIPDVKWWLDLDLPKMEE